MGKRELLGLFYLWLVNVTSVALPHDATACLQFVIMVLTYYFSYILLLMRAKKTNASLGKLTVSPYAPRPFWLAPPQRTLASSMLTSKVRPQPTLDTCLNKMNQLVYKK